MTKKTYLHPTKGWRTSPDFPDEDNKDDGEAVSEAAAPSIRTESKRYRRDVDVAQIYGVHRSTVWRWVREKIIPPPLKIAGSSRFDLAVTDEGVQREAAKNAA
ncbi:MAG: helix-turn-helix domain-containing protein [Pseudomonadota bacterium]